MSPIELLQNQLSLDERALEKSEKMYLVDHSIDLELHELHKSNLIPRIKKYKWAIKLLETYKYIDYSDETLN